MSIEKPWLVSYANFYVFFEEKSVLHYFLQLIPTSRISSHRKCFLYDFADFFTFLVILLSFIVAFLIVINISRFFKDAILYWSCRHSCILMKMDVLLRLDLITFINIIFPLPNQSNDDNYF